MTDSEQTVNSPSANASLVATTIAAMVTILAGAIVHTTAAAMVPMPV